MQHEKHDLKNHSKNHAQNVVEKLVPDPFLNNKIEHISESIVLKFYTVCSYCMTSLELSKYNETKLQITCFHLVLSFLEK